MVHRCPYICLLLCFIIPRCGVRPLGLMHRHYKIIPHSHSVDHPHLRITLTLVGSVFLFLADPLFNFFTRIKCLC